MEIFAFLDDVLVVCVCTIISIMALVHFFPSLWALIGWWFGYFEKCCILCYAFGVGYDVGGG